MSKELSKGFTGIEINGVRFSNIKEMLIYMNKQRDRIIDLEKKNAELKADNDARKFAMAMSEKVEKQLREENAELKSDNTEWERASDKWKSVYELTNNQLTNAKEIIRKFMKYEINEYDGSLEIHFEELKKQAERFLNNEVEK